jgi:hypothetical protein
MLMAVAIECPSRAKRFDQFQALWKSMQEILLGLEGKYPGFLSDLFDYCACDDGFDFWIAPCLIERMVDHRKKPGVKRIAYYKPYDYERSCYKNEIGIKFYNVSEKTMDREVARLNNGEIPRVTDDNSVLMKIRQELLKKGLQNRFGSKPAGLSNM